MKIRVPRMTIKTVPVTCRLDADLHADLEAYAAAYEAQYGEAMPLTVLITTIVRDYLHKDQAFMRQRRQAEALPRAQATPDSAARQPHGQDRHEGALSQPSHRINGGRRQEEQRTTDAITAHTITPRMRIFLAE